MATDFIDDKTARKRLLARTIRFTVPGTALAFIALYALVPPPAGMENLAERLALAFRWIFVAMLPYAAVRLTILARRFFEGAHNPLLGSESETLRIHCRVMTNTLEQFIWLAVSVLALATLLAPGQMRLIPIASGIFVLARLVYWWGFLRTGTLGRAPGVQITFTLNVSLLLLAAGLLVRSWLAA